MNSRIISAVAVYPAPSKTVELALWISELASVVRTLAAT
jgi:hypothetical protein